MDFPGGPVAKTPCSWCKGPGFNPRSGNYFPHATIKTLHSQISFLKKEKAKRAQNRKKELGNEMAKYAPEKDRSQFQEK